MTSGSPVISVQGGASRTPLRGAAKSASTSTRSGVTSGNGYLARGPARVVPSHKRAGDMQLVPAGPGISEHAGASADDQVDVAGGVGCSCSQGTHQDRSQDLRCDTAAG